MATWIACWYARWSSCRSAVQRSGAFTFSPPDVQSNAVTKGGIGDLAAFLIGQNDEAFVSAVTRICSRGATEH